MKGGVWKVARNRAGLLIESLFFLNNGRPFKSIRNTAFTANDKHHFSSLRSFYPHGKSYIGSFERRRIVDIVAATAFVWLSACMLIITHMAHDTGQGKDKSKRRGFVYMFFKYSQISG